MARLFSGGDGSVLATWAGETLAEEMGRAVAGVGDLTGDGVPDVIVGSPLADDTGVDAGLARVYSGGSGLLVHTLLSDCSIQAGALFGSAVAGAGDADGDDLPDVVVGAPGPHCTVLSARGAVWIFSGPTGALIVVVGGKEWIGKLGALVAGAGDVDADGRFDVVAGSPSRAQSSADVQGRARIYSADGAPPLLGSSGPIGAHYGAAVVGAGDFDLDGFCDVAVGAPDHSVGGAPSGQVTFVRSFALWTNLGQGLSGGSGTPSLTGQSLLAGGQLELDLAGAAADARLFLIVGFESMPVPFKGGTLVPAPDSVFAGTTNAAGGYRLFPHSTGPLPSGQEYYLQAWIEDAAGPAGLSASTALRATVP